MFHSRNQAKEFAVSFSTELENGDVRYDNTSISRMEAKFLLESNGFKGDFDKLLDEMRANNEWIILNSRTQLC